MNAYNTYITQILVGFPCSQAHNLLTSDQPDRKDNFSPIKKNSKKYNILTQISATAPLSAYSYCLQSNGIRHFPFMITHNFVRYASCHYWRFMWKTLLRHHLNYVIRSLHGSSVIFDCITHWNWSNMTKKVAGTLISWKQSIQLHYFVWDPQ